MKPGVYYNSLYFSDMLKKLPQDFSHRSFFFQLIRQIPHTISYDIPNPPTP